MKSIQQCFKHCAPKAAAGLLIHKQKTLHWREILGNTRTFHEQKRYTEEKPWTTRKKSPAPPEESEVKKGKNAPLCNFTPTILQGDRGIFVLRHTKKVVRFCYLNLIGSEQIPGFKLGCQWLHQNSECPCCPVSYHVTEKACEYHNPPIPSVWRAHLFDLFMFVCLGHFDQTVFTVLSKLSCL